MDRHAFLSRVREATGGRPPSAAPRFLSPSPAVTADAALTLAAELAQRWTRRNAAYHRVAASGAASTVAAILSSKEVRTVALSQVKLIAQVGLLEALARKGMTIVPLPKNTNEIRSVLAVVDAGVTVADYAIAETATVVEWASPEQPRALSLLPPVHVALVPAAGLRAMLDDLFADLEDRAQPSALTFVSGPSGTADIGMQHVVGVHGPREVHLVVLEGSLE